MDTQEIKKRTEATAYTRMKKARDKAKEQLEITKKFAEMHERENKLLKEKLKDHERLLEVLNFKDRKLNELETENMNLVKRINEVGNKKKKRGWFGG